MNELRLKEIREVLGYDQNINRKVLQLTKKKVNEISENVYPYDDTNEVEINETAKGLINDLIVDLTAIKAEALALYNREGKGETAYYNLLSSNIYNYQKIAIKYNKIVSLYIKQNSTQSTSDSIYFSLLKIKNLVEVIRNYFRSFIIKELNKPKDTKKVLLLNILRYT